MIHRILQYQCVPDKHVNVVHCRSVSVPALEKQTIQRTQTTQRTHWSLLGAIVTIIRTHHTLKNNVWPIFHTPCLVLISSVCYSCPNNSGLDFALEKGRVCSTQTSVQSLLNFLYRRNSQGELISCAPIVHHGSLSFLFVEHRRAEGMLKHLRDETKGIYRGAVLTIMHGRSRMTIGRGQTGDHGWPGTSGIKNRAR